MADIKDFYTGEKKEYKFYFGVGVDISNWTIWCVIKKRENDLDVNAIIRVSNTAGSNAKDDIANGLMYVTIDSDESDVVPSNYIYSFVRVIEGTAPPDVRVLKKGKIKILQNLNRTLV